MLGGINLEARKLIKFGNSSHVLALPHEWLKENKLNKGDLVYISKNGNNELVVAPERKEVKKELKVKSINIDGKDIERIQREIIVTYLNDYNIIKLNGKEIKDKISQIRNIIHDLFALEILEQDKSNIIARDFLNLETISIKKLIHKMDMITRSMFSEINVGITKKQCDLIIDRDKEMNRLYFLTMRAIKAGLNDAELRKKLNYTPNDLIYYWYALNKMESIADKLKGLSWFFTFLKEDNKIKTEIWDLYKKIERQYINVMKSFYFDNIDLAFELSSTKKKLQEECDLFLRKKNLDKISIRILDKLKTIIIEIHNIGREVYSK